MERNNRFHMQKQGFLVTFHFWLKYRFCISQFKIIFQDQIHFKVFKREVWKQCTVTLSLWMRLSCTKYKCYAIYTFFSSIPVDNKHSGALGFLHSLSLWGHVSFSVFFLGQPFDFPAYIPITWSTLRTPNMPAVANVWALSFAKLLSSWKLSPHNKMVTPLRTAEKGSDGSFPPPESTTKCPAPHFVGLGNAKT